MFRVKFEAVGNMVVVCFKGDRIKMQKCCNKKHAEEVAEYYQNINDNVKVVIVDDD